MSTVYDDALWSDYNAGQGEREVRPLCREVIEAAGPGAGRLAIDLGCGLGRETDALLRAGWRVHAIDMTPNTRDNVLATTRQEDQDRLTIEISPFAALTELPPADLVYSAYSIPYIPQDDFATLWRLIRSSLRPGAWVAVNLLGDEDSYAENDSDKFTFLTEDAGRELFSGMELVKFEVENRDGPSYSGPKHWHLMNVIARLP